MERPQITINMTLPVHDAVIGYALGFPSHLAWRARGIDGYGGTAEAEAEFQKVRDEFNRTLPARLQGSGKQDVTRFVEETLGMWGRFASGADILTESFPDQRFYFVIGAQRSGGTYMLSQIVRAAGMDLKSLSFEMVHDSIPSAHNIVGSRSDPTAHANALFEFFQFLNWAQRELSGASVVPMKRIVFAFWMAQLDAVVGSRATYVVTIRNPADTLLSFLHYGGGMNDDGTPLDDWEVAIRRNYGGWVTVAREFEDLDDESWNAMTGWRKFLRYWVSYYRAVVRPGYLRGRFMPVVFGDDFADFFTNEFPEFAGSNDVRVTATPRDQTTLKESLGIDDGETEEAVRAVEQEWARAGHRFPAEKIV